MTERPELPPPNVALANRSPKELARSDDPSKGWVRWEVSHEQLRHETRAYAGSFGDYEAHDEVPSFAELYGGVVAVSTDDPGIARAESESRFTMRFPEATCETRVAMSLTSTSGDVPAAARARRPARTARSGGRAAGIGRISRDLQ